MLGFFWLIMWLPRKWIMRIGRLLGEQMYRRNAKRRRIAEINIRLCFPHLSEIQQQQMVQEHFHYYGRSVADMGLVMLGSMRRIKQYSEVIGLEDMTELQQTRNIIVVFYHTIALDMGGFSALAETEMVSMMKRDRNPLLNWFVHRARTRHKKALIFMRDQGLHGIIKGINNGRVCHFLPDEDFGDGKHTVFAPFFGQQRSTLNTVSRLAKITDAVVIPSSCRLMPKSGTYRTTIGSPLDNFPAGDYVADATNIHQAMEQLILVAPAQYMWTFRWFRTQPDGKPSPYQ